MEGTVTTVSRGEGKGPLIQSLAGEGKGAVNTVSGREKPLIQYLEGERRGP